MFGDDVDQMIIVVASALLAMLSFVAVALPYLNRTDKKAHYQDVIEKKRKALMDQARESANRSSVYNPDAKTVSARESLVFFYKVQQLFGEMGEKAREQMLQAGIRDTKAPIIYLSARIIIPFVLTFGAWVIMVTGEREISPLMFIGILLGMGLAGFFLPRLLVKNHILKRQLEIGLMFPDALDMMLICVQGGIGLEQAILRVGDEISDHAPTLAEELGILSAEMGMLNDRRRALQDFAKRVGSGSAKSFATAMIQAEQYGTSVSGAMRVIADELRDQRMATAEQKAASLPPKLTVPMILFFLPALFIVILVPAFLAAKDAGI